VRFAAGHVVDDRYEVVEPLGEGGMSEAYKARDRRDDRLVVLKIPHPGIIGDIATYTRYEREMAIGRQLDHPNVQRLLAEGKPGGGTGPYMVLEYVEGKTLRDYLNKHAPLPIDEAIGQTLQLADALGYCHERGVIHRDLKPENILITPEGQLKLVDFGIALLRGARRLTFRHLSSSVGTPDYMAPEQVRGERGDERTDIYALGVMLYEMLTGEVPYQGDNPLAVMSQRVTADPPLLRQARRDAPPALEAVVFKALRRGPADRYASMADLRHDLEHLDQVEIPDYSAVIERPVETVPVLKTALIVVLVFAALGAVGVIAELAHRAQAVP